LTWRRLRADSRHLAPGTWQLASDLALRLVVVPGRVVVVCIGTAGLVVLLGGGEAFWLCLPTALLLAAPARGMREALVCAAFAVLAAALPSLASASLGPRPQLPLAIVVVGSSVAILQRVTGRLEGERESYRGAALSDPLTGLANRRALAERIRYEVARHSRQEHSFAVLALDLDGFKGVNDRFGHDAGDEILKDVAAALQDAVREQDTVARLGGDEFCVLAPETGRAGSEQLAARIEQELAKVTTGVRGLSASVGTAVFPEDGRNAPAVLTAADERQIDAKRRVHARSRRAA
jgi:diguanylate cyclase (GGDEF)-like protein